MPTVCSFSLLLLYNGLVLELLDKCGVFSTKTSERELEVLFPNPLPEDTMDKLQEAQLKKELGISREQILTELGYELAGKTGDQAAGE